jgi:hypothetical protein
VSLAPDPLVLAACGVDAQAALAIQTVTNADHGVYVSFN